MRFFVAILLCASLSGCSRQWYRAQADAQVEKILDTRKEQALGYAPKTEISTETVAAPSRKSYEKVPFTPLPPPSQSVLEIDRFTLPFGVLGPPAADELPPLIQGDDYEFAAFVSEQAKARLRLGPPADKVDIKRMALLDAIRYGSQHSRAFRARMEDLYLAALDVTLERHLFEPRPFARTSLTYDGGQEDMDFRSALAATGVAGVRQQLPYGGEVTAQALVSFIQALNDNTQDSENATLALTASIPLLRGAGMINLEPLISTERQLIYEVRGFEDFRRQFAVEIARTYFRLVNSQQSIQNRRLKYLSSTTLTERTRALFAAGRISFTEVQRSLQQQLRDENSLIQAQLDYEGQLDDFKIQLGMSIEQNLDVQAVSFDLVDPTVTSEEMVRLAEQYRLDLQTARDQIEDARRAVANAGNGLLPDLDFVASTELGNRDDTPAAALDARTLRYTGSLQLDLPVDRVSERNQYRAALIRFERQQRGFVETRDRIIANVRDSVRSLELSRVTLEIQRRAIDLAQRRVDYANELLTQGRVNARDVVEATTDLLNAQDAYNRARADLQIQVLQLLRDSGTLRVDPDSGAIGHALDLRSAATTTDNPRELGS